MSDYRLTDEGDYSVADERKWWRVGDFKCNSIENVISILPHIDDDAKFDCYPKCIHSFSHPKCNCEFVTMNKSQFMLLVSYTIGEK